MHIAVCDDNIADRKQTERLLGRQSDRIFKESGERLYIDSYGNVDAFMIHPQMYHGLFVDMTSSEKNGIEIARMLLERGVTKPIILCSSTIDYEQEATKFGLTEENILFLNKPIKVAELTEVMDKIKLMMGDPIKVLELRGQKDTIYAKGDDIICVKRKGSELEINLTEGRSISIIADIYNFYDQCAIFPQICPVSDAGLININHIASTSFGKVTLDNGMALSISLIYRNSIKQAKELLKELQEQANSDMDQRHK